MGWDGMAFWGGGNFFWRLEGMGGGLKMVNFGGVGIGIGET